MTKAPPTATISEIHESEKDFSTWFEDWCDLHRWEWRHISDSRRQAGGKLVGDAKAHDLPDYILVRERVVFVELKGWSLSKRDGWRRGFATDGQLQYLLQLHDAGAETYLLWPEDRALVERWLA